MPQLQRHDEFEARDIWLAAYLDAMGVPPLRAVPIDYRRCRFWFNNANDKAHALAQEWREGINAMVNGPAFAAAYRRMVAASKAAQLGENSYDRHHAA